MLDRWHLRALQPLGEGFAAAAMEVITADGARGVLKVGFPHPEATWEAVALDAMGPSLAPEVLREDPWTWSMLLSEVFPGTSLDLLPVDDALEVASGLILRLRTVDPPPGMPTLVDSVREFVTGANDRRDSQRARLADLGATGRVDAAFDLAAALCERPSDESFVHGDLNPSNVLFDHRRGWLAIDPKPMRGDAAYDAWPFIRQLGQTHASDLSATEVSRRIRIVAGITGIPERRLIEWSTVRAALSLTWYLDDRLARQAEREASMLETVSAVLDAVKHSAGP